MEKPQNIENIRHSLAHLLAASVLKKFPKSKLGIGPAIDNGFYYDIEFKDPITEEDLRVFEAEIKNLIKQNLKFSGEKITPLKAKKLFKDQPFKLELIKEFSANKKELTAYSTGEVFIDLCKGGHVKSTSEINPEAFKLTHTAGAYWKGDEKNKQLTRIYGLAFETKEELANYIKQQEEAKKRDHKVLGPQLDLFTFSELVGPGLPLFTPKGTIIRDILDSYIWELRKTRGYERVDIPHITKRELYEKSGHWEKYKNDLFTVKTREGHLYAMKPMNCPHHAQIYKRKQWSYKDLPQRYASTTKVYRDEQSGELAGLSRVLSITQDDAHVFCRESQIKEEMGKVWDIIEKFYGTLGFDPIPRLSLHDPKHIEKYLGSPALWKKAETALRELVKERGKNAEEAVGEAAFYGPKIDFIAKDSMGRKWQVATIQLDMNQPERFDLSCIGESGKEERITMIHAAITGSLERILSILIEHFGGAFPLWLSPTQARILPISEKFLEYGNEIKHELIKHDIRVDLPEPNETLGKRIRGSELEKIPYAIIIGEKEVAAKNLTARRYSDKSQKEYSLKDFIETLKKEIAEKK